VTGFVLVTRVRCSVAAAFDASLDIDLHLASMARSGERAVGGVTSGRIGLGESVTWRARHFGLPWRMTSKITEHERPSRFVDEQVSGPFRRWRHEHLFEADGAGTRMTDVIDFAAPAGPLGHLVAVTALRPYLKRLIARRNATLAAALEA
jgi:ligand-binding SRPBCC domain-containing protein